MKATNRKQVGLTGIETTAIGFGTGGIGNRNRPMNELTSQELVSKAWDAGIRTFDTAPMYGHGLAENRLGTGLRSRPREDFILSTKVGRLLRPARGNFDTGMWVDVPPMAITYDYSYDATLRSIEDSLQRMLVDRIDIVFIHDCDAWTHGPAWKDRFEEAMTGAYKALARLRAEGTIRAIGMGVNDAEACHLAAQREDFDVFLLARQYTLLGQDPLDNLFPLCLKRGISIFQGGAYHSGILATGPRPGATFDFEPASAQILKRAGQIQAICEKYSVPIGAAALQFSYAHPAVSTVLIGSSSLAQQSRSIEMMQTEIPPELWEDLRAKNLIRQDAPTPERQLGRANAN